MGTPSTSRIGRDDFDSPAPPNSPAKLLLLRVILAMDTADECEDLLRDGGKDGGEAFLLLTSGSQSFGLALLAFSKRSFA